MRGSKPSSSQALQSPRIGVEVQAYAWKSLIQPRAKSSPRIGMESYAYAWEASYFWARSIYYNSEDSSCSSLQELIKPRDLPHHKTPEEAWKLIETVADANQNFNQRATSKGVYEVAPSNSTVLAKSLVDIAAVLKEIKEGKQVTPTLLKRQLDDSQQKPVRHCEICSCNSHHTDECPQLQEDSAVASTHNFYDVTTNPPYNRQYYTQGGRNNQPAHLNPPQQQQAQPRQPYTYSQPQNSQNPRYQLPQNRQQYPPSNSPPFNYDEALHTSQRENQEIREVQKRTESQLTQLTEMLQGITSQPTQSPSPIPLPSQPLTNPKGGVNVFHNKEEKGEKDEDENEEGSVGWWYNLLAQLVDSDDEEDEERPLRKMKEIFTTADASIVSVIGIAKNILVRIGELVILADFHVIKSTKGKKGGTPQVLLGRPFLKTAGFKLIYYDEVFTFKVGNVIEIFHLTPPRKPRKKSLHQLQGSRRKGSPGRKAKMRKTPRGRSNDEKGTRDAPTQFKGERKKISLNNEKRKKKKKKEPDKGSTKKKGVLNYLSFDGLLGKLTALKNVLRHNENIDTHLGKNNSKWK
ncbi:hypothetical protein PIB30_093922 [Stylosanthes scabra]|uniref:Uncharacterized protein n=1 Tax=Stylosanthes scabra TaxID=79078 RepID=A0ABU6UXT2_9FABA|nr:hypothetical protein [Stylosanthes scabra]